MNSVNTGIRIISSTIIALLFSGLFLLFLPHLYQNIYLIYALPFIFILLFISFLKPNTTFIIIFFFRALLDPLLNDTRIDLLGINVGAGGAINFLVIFIFLIVFLKRPRLFFNNNVARGWLLYLFVCFIAILYSPDKGRAIKLWLDLSTYICMFLFPFYYIRNQFDKFHWLKILLFSSILPTIFAFINLIRGGEYSPEAGTRINGTFSHPNILAFYLVLIIVLIFFILKSNSYDTYKFKKNVLLGYLFCLFILLVATKTRSAWISCWVFFLIYGILKEKKFLLFSLVIPPILLLIPAFAHRVMDIFTGTSSIGYKGENSLQWRIDLWMHSLPWIKKNFIFGNGLASFLPLSSNFYNGRGNVPAHNIFLEILFETGIFGLISYLSIYFGLLSIFYKKMLLFKNKVSNEYAVMIAYIIGFLVSSYGDNMLYYLVFNWYIWFFIGIVLKSSQFDDDKNIRNNPVL